MRRLNLCQKTLLSDASYCPLLLTASRCFTKRGKKTFPATANNREKEGHLKRQVVHRNGTNCDNTFARCYVKVDEDKGGMEIFLLLVVLFVTRNSKSSFGFASSVGGSGVQKPEISHPRYIIIHVRVFLTCHQKLIFRLCYCDKLIF